MGEFYLQVRNFPCENIYVIIVRLFMHCFLNTIMNYHTLFSLYFNQWYPYIAKNYSVCDEDVLYVSLIIWFIVISKIWMLLNACSNFKYILYCLHWAFFRHNLWWDKSITIPKPYLHHVRCILHSIKFRVYHSCETDIFVQWSSNQSMLFHIFIVIR